MLERLGKNPLSLAAAFVAAALLGAGLFAVLQRFIPAANADRARTEAMIHDYILDHGEIIPEAVQRARDKDTARAIASLKPSIAVAYAGAEQGDAKGDVTVSAYLDYNCGYCRASLPAIAELVQRDPHVHVVYREFPVLAESSVTAARWALAAAEQGKFLGFHKALYAGGRADAPAIAAAAKAAGLDTAKAGATIAAPRIDQEIAKNHRVAESLGASGTTPFWVVGDQLIQGMVDYNRLATAVAEARKAK